MKELLLTLCLLGATGARAQVQPDKLPPLAACQALCEDLASKATVHALKGNLAVLRWLKRDCQEDCMSHTAKEVADARLWLAHCHPLVCFATRFICMRIRAADDKPCCRRCSCCRTDIPSCKLYNSLRTAETSYLVRFSL